MRLQDAGTVPPPSRPRTTARVCLVIVLAVFAFGTKVAEGQHAQHAMTDGNRTGPQVPAVASSATPFDALMSGAMASMDGAMKSAPMTGDPDHDFAAMMIPHHQGAIDMAKAELLYGRDPVVRRLAQEIIVTQMSEITVMQRQLGEQQANGAMQH